MSKLHRDVLVAVLSALATSLVLWLVGFLKVGVTEVAVDALANKLTTDADYVRRLQGPAGLGGKDGRDGSAVRSGLIVATLKDENKVLSRQLSSFSGGTFLNSATAKASNYFDIKISFIPPFQEPPNVVAVLSGFVIDGQRDTEKHTIELGVVPGSITRTDAVIMVNGEWPSKEWKGLNKIDVAWIASSK